MSETPQSSPSTLQSAARLALWLSFAAFLLIVIVFRTKISEIRFGNEGVSAKMVTTQEAQKLSPEDRKAASDELAQRVSSLEKEARTHANSNSQVPVQTQPARSESAPDTAPVSEATYQQPVQAQQPVQLSIPNIAGTWGSPIGLVYQVTQYGNYVLISELNQGVVEAAAAGQINGWSFSLPAQTLMNTTGVLTLTVSADQRHMSGQYRDNVTGQVMAMYLNR